jgi:hypothetical protein
VRIKLAISGLAFMACHQASVAPEEHPTAPTGPTLSAPAARLYAVHIKRPSKLGDRTRIIADDEKNERTSALVAGDATPRDSNRATRIHVDGTVVVLELQSDGRSPLRDEITVSEFWTSRDGGAKEVLAQAGAHVVVTRAAKKEDALATVDGRPASKSVRDALDAIMILTTHAGPSDDEIFGTTAPQSIGGEWAVNGPLAEKDLSVSGIIVAPGGVSGKTKLLGVQSVNGVDCLELQNAMTIGAIQSTGGLPPGSTVENASMDVALHLLLPVDQARLDVQSDMTLKMKGTFTVPSPKGAVRVTLESVEDKRGSVTPSPQ